MTTQIRSWIGLAALSLILLILEVGFGSLSTFPISLILPVGLAAWFLGRRAGIALALVVSALHFGLLLWAGAATMPVNMALFSSLLSISVLVAIVVLIDRVGLIQARLRKLADGTQAHLAAIVDSAEDAIISVDRQGVVQSWNAGAERIFGRSATAMIGQSIRLLFPDQQHAQIDSLLQRIRQGERVEAIESLCCRQDGSSVLIWLILSPIADRAQGVIGAALIGRDLSEQQQAQRRFERLVEAVPNAVVIVNQQGQIVQVNSQAEILFGYRRAELLGQRLEMLVPQRFRRQHAGDRDRFFDAPSTRPMGVGRDLFGLRKDGREVPIEIGLNPIRTDGDQLVLASIIDITERIQAAQRLLNSLREKEVLLKEIHHRVKNNLAVIGSLFYLQSTTTRDQQTLRVLQDCQDRVRSMAMVHERLYQSEDFASIDFAEYTRELAHQLFRNYALNPELIRLQLDLEQVPLAIDRAIPCGLILSELISNALKHAFPAGRNGNIRVSLHNDGDQGLILSVTDDGVGLPDQASLQAQHSLGMRLVHSLASQLDAQIEFIDCSPGTQARLSLEASHVHAS